MNYSDDYRELLGESRARGEWDDCAVLAVALTCEVSYDEAHAALRRLGRKDRGRTQASATYRACRSFGREVRVLYGWEGDLLHRPPPGHALRKAKTMISAERVLARIAPGRRFLLRCRGHIAAFDGHALQDWTKGRRHRITAIVEVI